MADKKLRDIFVLVGILTNFVRKILSVVNSSHISLCQSTSFCLGMCCELIGNERVSRLSQSLLVTIYIYIALFS